MAASPDPEKNTVLTLDDFFQTTPLGSIEKAIGNNLYGFNHRQIASAVPINKDNYGFTFFTRPQLNLTGDNIRNVRRFYPLLTTNPLTVHRFIRCVLDPRLAYEGVTCPLLDNQQAFITVLTNNLNNISGWPDIVVPTFTTKEGLYKEAYSQVDGIAENYSAYNINATFRNTRGDPIVYLFYVWAFYQSLVFQGLLVPYPDYIVQNRLDYNTRIYRLVLDVSRRYVTKIAACGIAFPISNPIGQFFDFSNDKPYNDQSRDITIQFQCLGAQYFDDILVKEFNYTTQIFNPDMRDGRRESTLVKLSTNLIGYFNNRGYPRINPDDYELEWWVPADFYRDRVQALFNSRLTVLDDYELQDTTEIGD
jgi:hypothetical protein